MNGFAKMDNLQQRIALWKDHMYRQECSDNFYYISGRYDADLLTLEELENVLHSLSSTDRN